MRRCHRSDYIIDKFQINTSLMFLLIVILWFKFYQRKTHIRSLN